MHAVVPMSEDHREGHERRPVSEELWSRLPEELWHPGSALLGLRHNRGMAGEGVFLGRADEVRRFSDALASLPYLGFAEDWPTVVVVHGLGGIGKSTLLRRLRELVSDPDAAVWVDFEEERKRQPQLFRGDLGPGLRTVLDAVMRACVEALESLGDRELAENAFDAYRADVVRLPHMLDQAQSALTEAQQTSRLTKEDISAVEKSVVALGSLVAGQPLTLPLGAAAGAAMGQSALSHAGWWRRLLGGSKVEAHDYELLTDPQGALARTFGDALAECSQLRPLLVFLDTSELVLHLMPWLRVAMRRSGGRALWVIGMRVESEATASGESEISTFVREVPNDRLRLMALTRFDDHTVRLYLAARLPDQDFTDDDVREVSDFTRGLPLAVSLVADLLSRGAGLGDACAVVERPQGVLEPVSPGEVVRALARRFLIHAERQPGEQARRDLHRILCLAIANGHPARNPSLLRALWGTTDDLFDALRDLASRHDFVLSGTFRLHDDVRDALRNDLVDPVRRTRIEPSCQRAVDSITIELQKRRALLPFLSDQMASDDYQALLLDYVWYSFWTAHEAGWQASLTLLPILAAVNETAAEALIGYMSWFADRGSQEEAELLADLAELAPPSFLDEWLARRRVEEPPSTRLRTRLTPVGLKRVAGVVPVPGLLGTDDDRQAALEVMRVRHDLREPTDQQDLSGDVNRLIQHAASSDQALAEPIAAALIAIARDQSQRFAGYAPLETAARAALAADDLARQRPWELETIASALARGPWCRSLAPQADELHKRAIDADPTDAGILGNYAYFLTDVRRDHDGAEALYRRALDADPTHANNLGNYANFLTDVRRDHDGAEALYRRALDADPTHANNLGNYAHLLFVLGDDTKAEALALRALDGASQAEAPLRAECNFYLFMHIPSRRFTSGSALKELLAHGVSTGSWDFRQNLSRCAAANDPRLPLLEAVAKALAAGDPSSLEEYPEWKRIG